jgi:hypothetical protein
VLGFEIGGVDVVGFGDVACDCGLACGFALNVCGWVTLGTVGITVVGGIC